MSDVLIERPELEGLGTYEFGWSDSDVAGASAKRGISPEVVADISALARVDGRLFGGDPARARKNNLVSYVPQSEAVDWDFPISVAEVVMMGRYGRLGPTRRRMRPTGRRLLGPSRGWG